MTTSHLRLVPESEVDALTSDSGPLVCGARAHDCHCDLPYEHMPFSVHECGVAGCFASWAGDPRRGTFMPVTLPTWPPPIIRIHIAP